MSLALSAPDGVRYLCERVYKEYSHTSPYPWLLRALAARGNDIVSGLTSPQTLNYIISGCDVCI